MIKALFLSICMALTAGQVFAAPININTAGADQIAKALKGVGPSKAAAIVAFRTENGPFTTLKELVNVKGIGKKTLESNKDDIIFVVNN